MFINNFDPVAFEVFSLEIRWYSLAYIFGIVLGWIYCKKKLIKEDSILESLISLKRAGASAIVSYFALEIAKKLKN